MRIKKGDLVKVIAGDRKRKGKVGRVLEVFPKRMRLKVEGVAEIKKHLKAQKHPKYPEGGIISDLATIPYSNVMLMSETQDRPVRLGVSYTDDKKKIRVARGNGVKAETL